MHLTGRPNTFLFLIRGSHLIIPRWRLESKGLVNSVSQTRLRPNASLSLSREAGEIAFSTRWHQNSYCRIRAGRATAARPTRFQLIHAVRSNARMYSMTDSDQPSMCVHLPYSPSLLLRSRYDLPL